MRKVIYYFTGTGNSLQIARGLSQLMDETTIHAISNTTDMDLSAEGIGFVFPVYLWGVPDIVLQFIQKIKRSNQDKYYFAIATYKSQPGDVIGQLQRKMRKKGMRLSAGFTVPMPGNNIIFYDLESISVQESKLNGSQTKLSEIARSIQSRQNIVPTVSIVERLLFSGLLHSLLTRTFQNSDKQFWIEEAACNKCGICAKVCPVANIKFSDGHPEWQHNCQQCQACINLCPSKAIQHGKTTKNRKRYINPTISVTDLFK